MSRDPGFTLVEVMVALLVIGLVYATAITAVGDFAAQRARLEETWPAHSIAWNRLVQTWLETRGAAPREQVSNGRLHAAGRDWTWRLEITKARGDDLYRYEVEVRDAAARPTSPSASLHAFFDTGAAGR